MLDAGLDRLFDEVEALGIVGGEHDRPFADRGNGTHGPVKPTV